MIDRSNVRPKGCGSGEVSTDLGDDQIGCISRDQMTNVIDDDKGAVPQAIGKVKTPWKRDDGVERAVDHESVARNLGDRLINQAPLVEQRSLVDEKAR